MARTSITLPISGAKFRELRERAGLNQTEVETLTEKNGSKVDRSRLSRIETGDVKPTPAQLRALLDLYDAVVEDVLDGAA